MVSFCFQLAGAILLAIGIWLSVDTSIADKFQITGDASLFRAASILFIVVGCIVFIVGFFGCCGAIKENSCMLCTVSQPGAPSNRTRACCVR